jgi:hypothetical protein
MQAGVLQCRVHPLQNTKGHNQITRYPQSENATGKQISARLCGKWQVSLRNDPTTTKEALPKTPTFRWAAVI